MASPVFQFDTLKYAKRLQSANVPPEQAEAQAEAMREVLIAAIQTADLATKADLDNAVARIDGNLQEMKSDQREMKAAQDNFEARLDSHQREMKAAQDNFEARINSHLREMKADLQAEIKSEMSKQLKWVVGTMIAGFGGMVAIMALMLGNLVPNQSAAIQPAATITAPVAQPPEPVQMPASTDEP